MRLHMWKGCPDHGFLLERLAPARSWISYKLGVLEKSYIVWVLIGKVYHVLKCMYEKVLYLLSKQLYESNICFGIRTNMSFYPSIFSLHFSFLSLKHMQISKELWYVPICTCEWLIWCMLDLLNIIFHSMIMKHYSLGTEII